MGGYSNSIIIVLLFVLAIFWYSQTKFKNKMLCYFLRPNRQRIKKFVPLYTRHVVFDRGKYGVGWYRVDPKCIVLEWYTSGVNKIFPTLVPTLDFEWHSPNPRNPDTGEISWKSPEVEAAGYQGHSYVGFTRAVAAQSGTKRNRILEFIPLIILGVLVIGLFLLWNYLGSINEHISILEQQQNLR